MFDLTEEIHGATEYLDIRERVVISPSAGRFVPLPPEIFTAEGEWAEDGQVLAEIHNGTDVTPVVSAFTGWVMGMRAVPGQPVEAGDQLFWIRT